METQMKTSRREAKKALVDEIAARLQRHRVITLADLKGIRGRQLQAIRKSLHGRAEIKVTKNTLVAKAIAKLSSKGNGTSKIAPYLTGSNALILTDMNPFELYFFLERNKVPAPAKTGDTAPDELVVPAGNTGFPPGPILSKFGKLKIQTRIEEGSIWVVKDTAVASRGDTVTAEMAEILARLGIQPMHVGLSLKAAYDSGLLIGPEHLKVNLEDVKRDTLKGYKHAIALAMTSGFPTAETLGPMIAKCYLQAKALAREAAFITAETAPDVIGRAERIAQALAKKVGAAS